MIKKMIILMIVNLLLLNIYSQEKDSLKTNQPPSVSYKQIIIPTSLIAGGLILKNSKLNEKLQQETNSIFGSNFKTKIDNYTQLIPIAQIYGGRILGLKPKNDFIHQSINIFTAGITMCVITKT